MSKRKYKSIFDGRCRSEWMHLIDEWIHDELDRKMVVLHHLDGHSYDRVCDDIGNALEMSRRSYADGSSYEGSYADEGSYARGRLRAPRDSMGRYSGARGYSRHGEDKAVEVLDDLRGIVRELPKDAKYEVERIIKKHEDVYA